MKNFKLAIVTIISFLFVFQLVGEANVQTKTATLAKGRYSDPNGYFKIVPPEGWQIQQYPQEPRGKVAFIGPDGVELRILAKGLDYNTFEEMLEEIKGIERKIGTNTYIEKITFAGKPAIKRTFTLKGQKILFIDFMIGNTTHNLMYSTAPTEFDKYLSLVQASIDTYEPTLRGVSPEDVKKHTIAQSLRLSQIFFEQGNYDLALEFIKEGLEVEPNNTNLLELKNKISGLVDANPKKEEKTNNKSEKKDSSDNQGPGLFIILALAGAAIITFRKNIAAGTAAPGLAGLTAPIIGAIMVFYGLIEGLFGGGHIFLGIVTSLTMLLILASPILFRVISEKKGGK